MRSRPNVPLSIPDEGYARMVAWGWDSAQEAWPCAPDGALVKRLEEGKLKAREARDNGEGVALIEVGGQEFLIHATGAAGGVSYRLENDDVIYLIRSEACDWGVSVRYKSAGLWEHGWTALRAEAREFISGAFVEKLPEEPRISRADYAFDFFSPAFTREFDAVTLRKLIVCHSSTKVRWHAAIIGSSVRDETLTIGSPASLQLTVYDKATEVNEVSGKTWFEELWARTTMGEVLYYDADTNPEAKPRDVWRLEVRMGKGFLKNRNAQPLREFDAYYRELIGEALTKIRLGALLGEACVRNRPIHPLWSLAYEHVATGRDEMLPLGRRVVGRRAALLARAEAQIAGATRSAAVLSGRAPDQEGLEIILRRARELSLADPHGKRKEQAARDRYEFVDEAA